MCHIGRDGEENEMRMHRSISLKVIGFLRKLWAKKKKERECCGQ